MLRSMIAAALAFAILAISGTAAEAKAQQKDGRSVVTQFCGARYGACNDEPQKVQRVGHLAKRTRSAKKNGHSAVMTAVAELETAVPADDADAGWPRTLNPPVSQEDLTTIDGCAGLRLRVASEHASKFQGFFCALHAAGYQLKGSGWTGCQAFGHMSGSKHDWGGACDIRQRGRNLTAAFMYHVTALAARFGLKDGCTWHGRPDCGHVEVVGSNRSARAAHYSRYHRKIRLVQR